MSNDACALPPRQVAQVSWLTSISKEGSFVRAQSSFRNTLGSEEFPVESGRYHFYFALACPWAHRVRLTLKLLQLESFFSWDFVDSFLDDNGWSFRNLPNGVDSVLGVPLLRNVYLLSDSQYSGRVTVPVLFDRHTKRIVNNESSEIIRQLLHIAEPKLRKNDSLARPALWEPTDGEIGEDHRRLLELTYEGLNNGVYRCGFAQSQQAYEKAAADVEKTLAMLEERLSRPGAGPWLFGDRPTLADVRVWPTLIRFGPVYETHFKCNWRPFTSYTALWRYTRRLFQVFESTTDIQSIKEHYFTSHRTINPFGIVPVGPKLNYSLSDDEKCDLKAFNL